MRILLWLITVLSPLAALYCIAGYIQAASLFSSERQQINFQIWGALFLVCVAAFIGCAIDLWLVHSRNIEATKDPA